MKENIIADKTYNFAVRIVNLYKYLIKTEKEFVMPKQLLRCGTSIGANVSEAVKAQTTADFYTKLTIALKEANETQYWIKLLYDTGYLTEEQYLSIRKDIDEIVAILVAITKTTKEKIKHKNIKKS